MPIKTHVLSMVLLVSLFAQVFSIDALVSVPQRCRCLGSSHTVIDSKTFKRIEIIPPRAMCRRTEIIITKNNNDVICVAPNAQWIREVIEKVMKRRQSRPRTPTTD